MFALLVSFASSSSNKHSLSQRQNVESLESSIHHSRSNRAVQPQIAQPTALCSGQAPLPNFTCSEGLWISPSNVTLNSSIVIAPNSHIAINGTLTLNYRADIEFMDLSSRLYIADCLVTGGYKHSVVFNLTNSAAPKHPTQVTTYITSSTNCTDTIPNLSVKIIDGDYCRRTSMHSYSAHNESLTISFASSNLNCVLMYSIIGTVAGLLATTVSITVAALFWLRRNRSEDYAKAFEPGVEATKIRGTGH